MSIKSFQSLGLDSELVRVVAAAQFSTPYPIQQEAIPAVLSGRDVLGIAKTGSGKTAGYVLPILHQLLQPRARRNSDHLGPSVLVLVPTRELAVQVQQVFDQFGKGLVDRLRSMAVFGGVSINPQMQAVRNVDVLVATPGRLIDLEEKNAVKLGMVTTLVLDEADKMLHMGFREEVDRILRLVPSQRQNLLFSATLSDNLSHIHSILLRDPKVIKIASEEDEVELIQQRAFLVAPERKGPFLRHLIRSENLQKTLIFASSVYQAEHVADKLRKNKIYAKAMHGKLSQGTRHETLERFKEGSIRILVATDLLARGVDIDSLPCVINYELPRSPKGYIHRIGRTGRAGSPGLALSLITPDDRHHFKVIQKKMGKWLTLEHTDQLEF